MRTRIRVRHHPITVRYPRRACVGHPYILFPSLPSIHKDLVGNLHLLLNAMAVADSRLQVRVTAAAAQLNGLDRNPRIVALGPQTLDEMDHLWAEADAAYAPTEVESFGFPVAEARAVGLPVLAIDNARNREIGGDALIGYNPSKRNSLATAIAIIAAHNSAPDPTPFDPDAYFKWMISMSAEERNTTPSG